MKLASLFPYICVVNKKGMLSQVMKSDNKKDLLKAFYMVKTCLAHMFSKFCWTEASDCVTEVFSFKHA